MFVLIVMTRGLRIKSRVDCQIKICMELARVRIFAFSKKEAEKILTLFRIKSLIFFSTVEEQNERLIAKCQKQIAKMCAII